MDNDVCIVFDYRSNKDILSIQEIDDALDKNTLYVQIGNSKIYKVKDIYTTYLHYIELELEEFGKLWIENKPGASCRLFIK